MDAQPLLQKVLMPVIHGVRSFEGWRARSAIRKIGDAEVRLASPRDIISSKRTAARPRDLAVLPVLESTLHEIEKRAKDKKG